MNHSINRFFDKSECDEIIKFALEQGVPFSYKEEEKKSWDCRRIYDDNFKEKIINKFTKLDNEDNLKLWLNFKDFNIRDVNVSLTRYYDGRFLELHKDSTSQLTTVIVLTEDFNDGRFILSNSLVNLDYSNPIGVDIIDVSMGHGISFDGSKTFHGVLPVKTGLRCALNVWMTNTEFKYNHTSQRKSII